MAATDSDDKKILFNRSHITEMNDSHFIINDKSKNVRMVIYTSEVYLQVFFVLLFHIWLIISYINRFLLASEFLNLILVAGTKTAKTVNKFNKKASSCIIQCFKLRCVVWHCRQRRLSIFIPSQKTPSLKFVVSIILKFVSRTVRGIAETLNNQNI